tara:strand:- start:15459 stop:16466 length:1008 start_codon:yes stop_codon:yes gene_type:complete
VKLSVVVPCRNEVGHIKKCVDNIYSNSICKVEPIEVIVVDGESDDGTLKVLEELQKVYPSLKVVNNQLRVTPIAFNLGIKHSKGSYIQIVGARQFVSHDYFEKAIKKFESSSEIWCIGGMVENLFEDDTSLIISEAMNSSFGVGTGNFRIAKKSTFVDTVGTPMYPAWVFDRIGYFDESLVRNQDDEFNFRVTRAGGKILLYTEIKISYVVRAQMNKLFKQYWQYGYWKVFVNKKHNTVTNVRQLVPFLFVAFIFSFFLWPIFGLSFVYLGVLLLYFLGACYFGIKATSKLYNLPHVVYTFFILHFSYGLGYANGILDFYILNRTPRDSHRKISR